MKINGIRVVFADDIETSEEQTNETMENSTVASSSEPTATDNEQLSEAIADLQGTATLILFVLIVYFACHTIHNVFNKIRGAN